jgi:two-component system, NtrC family, sensor kinase
MPAPINENLEVLSSQDAADEVSKRILIVDDEQLVRNMFSNFLSDHYVCTTAASSEEALACLAAEAYAVVIADIKMPGRNGVELLREIRSRYPDTAVIMVSALSRPQRIRDALQIGAFDYLIKPCELDVLLLSVERALERRALTITARSYRAHLERQNDELAARQAELERLQAQLVHSEKMASLGQLAAGIAHELNNPAGFIYGNTDLLAKYVKRLHQLLRLYDNAEFPPDLKDQIESTKLKIGYATLMEDFRSMLTDCHEGAERIRDVVQNLRLFSRLDEAEFKKVDLHEGIDSTIRLLSSFYSSGPISLRKDYGDLPLVDCYAGQLNQVWTNLLVNAAQSIDGPGEVVISTRVAGESIEISVSDTGCGIPPEQLSRIFDPFFTTKPIGEGSGLGLSISYGIIEKHNGTIKAESTVGEGTKFTINIPIRTRVDSLHQSGESIDVHFQQGGLTDEVQTPHR